MQTARDARASVVSSFDVLIARTGHTTNEIMKVLTLASVILLPGTLVAGVLGMNFKVPLFTHPELFWVVVALIVAGRLGHVDRREAASLDLTPLTRRARRPRAPFLEPLRLGVDLGARRAARRSSATARRA